MGTTAAIAVAIAVATAQRWPEVHRTVALLRWPALALALIVNLAGVYAGMMAWRTALADLGHRLPVRAAAQVCLVGQLGKYLPGSVWAYLLQMQLGRRAGVPRMAALLASIVATALSVTAGLTVGLLGLPALLGAAHGRDGTAGRLAIYLLIALVPLALCCAHPRLLSRLVTGLLRLARHRGPAATLTWRGVLRTLGWSALAYLLLGTHLWLLAIALGAPGAAALMRSVGAMALAMTISVFAVVIPSGLGVREFILVTALAPYLGSAGAALGVALSSRVIFTLADVVAAALAAGFAAGITARRPQRPAAFPTPAEAAAVPPVDTAPNRPPAGTAPNRPPVDTAPNRPPVDAAPGA